MEYLSAETFQPTVFYSHQERRTVANTTARATIQHPFRTLHQYVSESSVRLPEQNRQQRRSSIHDFTSFSIRTLSSPTTANEQPVSMATRGHLVSNTMISQPSHFSTACYPTYRYPSPNSTRLQTSSLPAEQSQTPTQQQQQPLTYQQTQMPQQHSPTHQQPQTPPERSTIYRANHAPSRRRALSYYPSSLLSFRRREERDYLTRHNNGVAQNGDTPITVNRISVSQDNEPTPPAETIVISQPHTTIRRTFDSHSGMTRYQESLGLRSSTDVPQVIDSASNAVAISNEPFTGIPTTATETVQYFPPHRHNRQRRRSDIVYEYDSDMYENNRRRVPLRRNNVYRSMEIIKGVPSEVIDMLPVELYTSELSSSFTTCDICLLDYVINDQFRRLACLHCFHSDCIDQWLKSHIACPVCRMPVIDGLEQSDLDDMQRELLQKLKSGKYPGEETDGTCTGNLDTLFSVVEYPLTRLPLNITRAPL